MLIVPSLLAFVLPISIIARATAMFMGLCAAAFLPAFGVGIYANIPSTKAAIASIISGAAIWFLWTAFIHTAEAKPLGLCQSIFAKPVLLPRPWSVIDPLVIALPVSIIVMVVMQWQSGKNASPCRGKNHPPPQETFFVQRDES